MGGNAAYPNEALEPAVQVIGFALRGSGIVVRHLGLPEIVGLRVTPCLHVLNPDARPLVEIGRLDLRDVSAELAVKAGTG